MPRQDRLNPVSRITKTNEREENEKGKKKGFNNNNKKLHYIIIKKFKAKNYLK